MKHHPPEAVTSLFEKLASRARHLVYLLGAGCSCAAKLPDLAGIQQHVSGALEGVDKQRFDRLSTGRNLEQVLTRLRLIREALTDSDGRLDDLSSVEAGELDGRVCFAIATILTKTPADLTAHVRFAQWVSLSQYDRPIEIFTTNYDLLIEKGMEAAGTPYFDGFVGIYDGRFRSDLVEDDVAHQAVRLPRGWARIWKLHGSVSWVIGDREGVRIIARSSREDLQRPLAIFPSFQKYEESRRLPFVALGDRLRRALAIPETLVVVCGYSFGDQHINELLFDAARFYPRSEIVALFFSDIPATVQAQAGVTPNLTAIGSKEAILGGVRREWEPPTDPHEFWSNGGCTLGDFRVLATLLARRAGTPSALEASQHGTATTQPPSN